LPAFEEEKNARKTSEKREINLMWINFSPKKDVTMVNKQVSDNVRFHVSRQRKTDRSICGCVLSKIHESENMKLWRF
jgi:hypothetical protein